MTREYRIIENVSRQNLVRDVQVLLDQGWDLAGGVAATSYYNSSQSHDCYCQALVFTHKPRIKAE